MLTLSLPDSSSTVYPRTNFTGMDNLLRVTEFNRRDFREDTSADIFTLEDQHILVQLLYHLTIDVEWTLEQVVTQTRFRANMLCSLFNITSMNKTGAARYNGFYRDGVLEHWVLIDNEKRYSVDSFQLDTMRALVPLYSTVTTRGYKHNALKDRSTPKPPNGFAIIGIDLVELAVGWWTYMRQDRSKNLGIHQYCCQYPLFTAQLIHNQLAVINILYDFLVKDEPLDSLVSTDVVQFTTMNEDKLFKQYLAHMVNDMTGPRLDDIGHMMSKIRSIYRVPYFNYVSSGKYQLLQQTKWAWELAPLKLHAIYLSIANRMGYRASDVNIVIDRVLPAMIRNYSRIPEPFCRELVVALASEVSRLNIQNMK